MLVFSKPIKPAPHILRHYVSILTHYPKPKKEDAGEVRTSAPTSPLGTPNLAVLEVLPLYLSAGDFKKTWATI